MTDYFDTLAGRAGTTPLSPPLRPPQPDKAVQGKELYAHATTVLGPTRGVNPLPNLEAIVYPLATYNYLDRILVLESKRSSLMQVHDQGHRNGAAALPVVLCILVLPREEGRGGSVPPLSGTGWGATCRERIALMDLLDLAYLLEAGREAFVQLISIC